MTKELEALERINQKFVQKEWNNKPRETEKDFDTIETALKELIEYKKVFEKLNLDISDSVDLENWIKLAQFHYENKNKKLKALEIIKEKEVNVHNFKEIIIKHKWNYEQYVDEENDPNTSGHQFAYKLLTQEEYDLLKEVLL